MSKLNEKTFNVTLKAISGNGDKLAQLIHVAGLFALAQVNEHGNSGFGERLLEAMGKKHDVKRVEKWLCFFGKFGIKAGKLVYRARRDIAPENLDAWAKKAEECPYYELTAQEHHKMTFDGLGLLTAILNQYARTKQKEAAGLPVTIKNEGVLADITSLLEKHNKAVITPTPVGVTA